MADYSDSKDSLGTYHDPDNTVDAGFSRYEPLITGKKVIDQFLFGINLKSPATKQEMTAEMVDEHILDAIAEIEQEVGMQIFPTQHDERYEFDRNEYMAMGYFRLRSRPVQSIESLRVVSANDQSMWNVSLDWVDTGYMSKGLIYIIPMNIASAQSASGVSAGGTAFLAILGQQGWVPAFWRIKYTTGFKDGKLPRAVNILIGCQAAINVLNLMAQANAKSGSKSIGIDGLSQSSSNPGPDVYKVAIDALMLRKKMLVGKMKNAYGLKLFSGNV